MRRTGLGSSNAGVAESHNRVDLRTDWCWGVEACFAEASS